MSGGCSTDAQFTVPPTSAASKTSVATHSCISSWFTLKLYVPLHWTTGLFNIHLLTKPERFIFSILFMVFYLLCYWEGFIQEAYKHFSIGMLQLEGFWSYKNTAPIFDLWHHDSWGEHSANKLVLYFFILAYLLFQHTLSCCPFIFTSRSQTGRSTWGRGCWARAARRAQISSSECLHRTGQRWGHCQSETLCVSQMACIPYIVQYFWPDPY